MPTAKIMTYPDKFAVVVPVCGGAEEGPEIGSSKEACKYQFHGVFTCFLLFYKNKYFKVFK